MVGIMQQVKGLLAGYPDATPGQLEQIKQAKSSYYAKKKDGSYKKMIGVTNPQGGMMMADEEQRLQALKAEINRIMGEYGASKTPDATVYPSETKDTGVGAPGSVGGVLPEQGNY